MSTTDTKVNELIINSMSKAKFDELLDGGQISNTELYIIKDEDYYTQTEITYGTTTYSQITQMLANGIQPVCNYNGYRYYYAGFDTDYYFTCVVNGHVKTIKVDNNNTWSNNDIMLPTVTIIDWSE